MSQRIDLTQPLRIHLVGAGGAGMSAIAMVLQAMGHSVSGSDLKDSPALERLRAGGGPFWTGHDAIHVNGADLVALSSAIPPDNAEVGAARGLGIPVVDRATLLASVAASRSAAAVAGTHGKTTTSSMLTLVLIEAGMDPSFIVGGELNEVGSGAGFGRGEWMVVEADESDGTFLALECRAAVITNIEPDHLDHYGSFPALVGAFQEFANRVDGPVVACADDRWTIEVARTLDGRAVTYGTSPESTYQIVDAVVDRDSVGFAVVGPDGSPVLCRVPVPGMHIARNATAALVTGMALGVEPAVGSRALSRFTGVARRYQLRGVRNGVTFVDDYAHLPGEIAATIDAARAGGWGRIVCLFQPHRYSRIGALWDSYGTAFRGADLVVVSGIYPAGEAPVPGVSGELVLRSLQKDAPGIPASFIPDRAGVTAHLRDVLRPGDLCLVLSAGDMTGIVDDVYP